jgi:hypothetical protein
MTEKRVALIVASYQYEDADLRQLVAPAQDAEALARVLADPAIGSFEVQMLLNELSYKVNRAIEAFFTDRKRDDLLLLYFSGHGIKDEEGRLYFATIDTRRKLLRATAIPAALVNDVMRYSRSRRQVLLLDCCYSGAFAKEMVAKADEGMGTQDRFKGRGRVVLTASDAMQYAFEGDEVKGKGVRSVFTRTLVHGLETGEADLNGDGYVSLDELYDYVYNCVTDETPQQRPGKWAFDVQGEIVIAQSPGQIVEEEELTSELQPTESLFAWVREGVARKLDRLRLGKKRVSRRAALLAALGLLLVALAVVGGVISTSFHRGEPPILGPTCQPSATPVRVGMTQLPKCPNGFQARLVDSWMSEAEVISLEQASQTSSEARARSGFDIVVWGSCDEQESEAVTLNYELITTRKPDEVYEPLSLNITGSLTDTVGVGLALISYQHGDYAEAADRFNELPATQTSPEQALLWANSLLFAGRYDAAIDAYDGAVLTLKPGWSAAHNNLGVARFNKDLLDPEGSPLAGLHDYERAIELANDQGEDELALLAHVNKSEIHRLAGNWRDAKASCESARSLNDQSALPYVCLACYSFVFYRSPDSTGGIPLNDIKQYLDQAEQFDDAPATLHYLRAAWHKEQKQNQEAIVTYERFFALMEHRACLQTDKISLRNAAYFVDKLTR